VNSCVISPEDGPVGPKHVEIRRNMNKIEIVTSVGFSFHTLLSHLDLIIPTCRQKQQIPPKLRFLRKRQFGVKTQKTTR
jgi:hypothetical protein